MELDRRELVRASAAGLALFALPGMFAARARAEKAQVAQPREREGTRFVLVLHASEDLGQRMELGECFGSFLLHAEDEQLAPLAVCDITSATTEEMLGLPWPGAPVQAVLLEPAGKALPALIGDLWRSSGIGQSRRLTDEEVEACYRAVHASIAGQLARVIPGERAALEAWAARERAELGKLPNPTSPKLANARRFPWQARLCMLDMPNRRKAWLQVLAQSVRDRWESRAPVGAVWGWHGGCWGPVFKGPPEMANNGGGPCGTGYVPELSARFLHFYREEELVGFVGPPRPR